MHTIIEKNKKYLKFVLIVTIIGLFFGIFYYFFLSGDTKLNITNTITNYEYFRYNFILKDLIIMSLILILSFFVVGVPLGIFFLFYEGLSIGFLLSIFGMIFGLKGIIYTILYILINKLITYILLILFLQKIINIGRYMIGFFLYKRDNVIKDKLILNFKNSLYIIIFVLIINVILYFISPIIFKYFSFLLK